MKIKTLNLIAPVGMSRVLEAKDVNFFPDTLGVEIVPKGVPSFRNRPRFIPWANISSCDILTQEESDKLELDELIREEARAAAQVPPPADPITVPIQPDPAPEAPAKDDVIRFTKAPGGGVIETKGKPDAAKSAFAAAAKAKASTAPE